MKSLSLFPILIALLSSASLIHAQEERTMTPEQMEQLQKDGQLEAEATARPVGLLDFTKGDLPPTGKKSPTVWTLGPTGIIGVMNHATNGDQFLVRGTRKGSPAEGKFVNGDVIVGMNGTRFKSTHLGILIGNAIIEAEKEANGGKISFDVWRDKNYVARNGKQDIAGVDIDKIFNEADEDGTLYDWKSDEQQTEEVKQMGFDKYPVDPLEFSEEVTIRTFPEYADTAPYDCPKTAKILEEAWSVLEEKFTEDPKNPRKRIGGVLEAVALISSGKPEHRELVKKWVRSKHCPWKPPVDPPGTMFKPGYRGYMGSQSWHHGFIGLYCAIYYEATGDDYVLPALEKYAIDTAMGQSALGTWGHTFAYPSFNGGELHKMNPGYGALNAAGNRCYFLITLAQKLGVKHPEIDLAVKRATRFFSSYIDQGCIPYGDHSAAASDDSNGKNTGVAFSLKLLGDEYGARYFAMLSSHCAFTRRGGHGHDYHGNWSSWAASLCGPEVRTYNERNLRWRRTLCRMHDGSFVYASPTGPYKTLRDPTATEVLHQAVALKQTVITGKEIGEPIHATERDMKQLLASARPQLNDPWLLEKAGKPMNERSTDELFDMLDHFFPKARAGVAKLIGERAKAGEKEILPRLIELLESDNARYREGALLALGTCGEDVVLSNLSKLTPLLQDPHDFVRISAIKVISRHTNSPETQKPMLLATIDEPKAISPNSFRGVAQNILFGGDTPLANNPFESGLDEDTVRKALEAVILLDPAGRYFLSSRKDVWTKDTVIRVAGPLTYAAEEEQIGDQMFANRTEPAQEMLGMFGYAEGIHATAHRLRKQAAIRRDVRPYVRFKDSLMNVETIENHPDAFLEFIDEMEIVLTDDPSTQIEKPAPHNKVILVPLERMYHLVKAQKKPKVMPSLADDVRRYFQAELDKLEGTGAKMKYCRAALENPESKNHFQKIAAIDSLAELLGADALEDMLPYLGSEYWRLREHCQKLAAELVVSGGGAALASHFDQTTTPETMVGILEVFAASKHQSGLAVSRKAMQHESAAVRAAAVKAYAALGGDKVVTEIIDHLRNAAVKEDMLGCEEALLSWRDKPDQIAQIRESLITMLPAAELEVKKSIYYVLSKIGDTKSIAALRKASATDSMEEFDEIIFALSYSPSREADKLMLDLAAADKRVAQNVAAYSMRRMVLGPKGFGDITLDEKMDFAEAMLHMVRDRRLVQYLANVHHARALRALMYCLENGTEIAAESLVSSAEGLKNLSPADAKIAVKSLQDVIEYIEVTRLRGGIEAHMDKHDNYLEWKALQARAGQVLLKIHKPEEAPIPQFDPLEFE